mmetsp:Transcript_32196/g.125913  ORF Transcript_32196/g.125913 Transcript_32196/m.125913 type:complete len:361 (-) Transcript_32196:788-1870(-)
MGVGFVLVTPPTGEHRGRRLVSGLNRRATVKVFTGAQTLAPLEKRVAEIEEESETVELSQRNLNVKAFAVGATAGLIGSMIGAGGGIVLTPLMTSFLKLSQHEAHGTALVAVALSSFLGSAAYARGGSVNIFAAVILCGAAVITARLGAMRSQKIDAKKLRACFGGFLLVLAVFIQAQSLFTLFAGATATQYAAITSSKIGILLGAGSGTGFISGLLGIGGGTLMVPVLTVFAGLTQKVAQGTALAAMVLPAIMGCLTYVSQGCVRGNVLPGLLTGVSIGAFLGGNFALQMPETLLRLFCGVIFVLTGCKLLGFIGGRKPAYSMASPEQDCLELPAKYIWDDFVLDHYDHSECEHMGAGI